MADDVNGNPGVVPDGGDRPKHAGGRPTLYKPEYCELARNYCLLGATNRELGKSFNVDEDTIVEWMTVHVEFSGAVKDGREDADAKVASSLFKRAQGFTHGEVYYPPDTGAALAWLANRTRKRENVWKTRHDHQQIEGSLSLADIAARVGGADEPADGQ